MISKTLDFVKLVILYSMGIVVL